MDGLGAARLPGALRNAEAPCRFYRASASGLFGATPPTQSEGSPFRPCSPYVIDKLYAHGMGAYYRAAHDLFACNGILFNHESPRRGENLVKCKTIRGVAAILTTGTGLRLASLDARCDWGHARDYLESMWIMLPQPAPSDSVIWTGINRPVQDLVELAFRPVGLDWPGHADLHPAYDLPAELPALLADLSEPEWELWCYPRIGFEELIREMLEAGLDPNRYITSTPTPQAKGMEIAPALSPFGARPE